MLFQLVFVIAESLSTTTDDPAPSEYKKRKVLSCAWLDLSSWKKYQPTLPVV